MAQLLREFVSLSYDKNSIKEARAQGKPILLNGIFQKANLLNANKRIYPRPILEREINNYQKVVKENRAVGTLDHEDTSVINLKNVSHVVREINWKGDDVCGVIELLNTPQGKIAQDLLEGGIQIGISSRALGETEKDHAGNDVVKEDLILLSFDLVQEPSTPGAWLHLQESKQIDHRSVMRSLPKSYRINRILQEILEEKKK